MKQASTLFAAILVAVAASPIAHAKQFTIQWGHYLSNGPFLKVEEQFANRVEERSEGRVKFNLAYSEALGKGNELLSLAGRGAINMAAVVPGYYPDRLLYSKALQIPFVFDSPAEAIEVAKHSYANIEAFQNEMDKNRVHYLFHQPLGSYYMTGPSEDCKSIAGLKGKKIRTFGSDIPKIMEAVGAVPLSMSIPNLYEALERGTLDYSFLNPGLIETYRLHEPGAYTCGPVMSMAGHLVVMSKRTWDRLPKDIQQIITEEAAAAQDRYVEWVQQSDAKSLENMKAAGAKVTIISDEYRNQWMDATPDLLQQWVEDMKQRGEGDTAAAVAEKWRELTAD